MASLESPVIEKPVAEPLLSAIVTVRVTCQSLSQLNMYAGSESPPVAKIVPVPQTPLFTWLATYLLLHAKPNSYQVYGVPMA